MRGLVMISTAPAARACMVVWAPFSVSEEQITTGVGRSAMSFFMKVMPSMRGISTSSTMTSGHSRFIFSRANRGSAAVAITRRSGAASRMPDSTCRTVAESSTIMTFTGAFMRLSSRRVRPSSGVGCA